MHINNYKIDFIGRTAAHYTTFPQTDQSAALLAKNGSNLSDRAASVKSSIGAEATAGYRSTIKGMSLDVRV